MKTIQNTVKIDKKISDVLKKIRVGPKKVGSVGFSETRHALGPKRFLLLRKSVNLATLQPHQLCQR